MTTSTFFNNYEASNEQQLLEDLIIESIQISGVDATYVARDYQNYNDLMDTDDQSIYNRAWTLEVYLKNIYGFGGDRSLMSKFAGLEVHDQMIFTMSRRRFYDEIGRELNTIRPREGDLLFFGARRPGITTPFPHAQKVFQIKFVDQGEEFYQLGSLYTWEVTAEMFDYSSETFDTGILEIDRIQTKSINVHDYALMDTDGTALIFENGDYWTTEKYDLERIVPLSDNQDVQDEAEQIVQWGEYDPFSESGVEDKEI